MAALTTNYTYDQADRLTTYNAGPNATTYAYNGDGLRMTKASTLAVTHFSWDIGVEAGLPVLMQDNAGSYIYGPGGILLEEIVPGAGPGTYVPYYYHTDRLGSMRALTNGSGNVANTYTYDAYGKKLTSTGSVSNPFGYTGEYTDAESGFVYLRARYYDPESQQFLTVDPALAWTEEAYAYVGGSPTNVTDPTGLSAKIGKFTCEDIGLETGSDGGCKLKLKLMLGIIIIPMPGIGAAGVGAGAAAEGIGGMSASQVCATAILAATTAIKALHDATTFVPTQVEARKADIQQIDRIVKKYGLSRDQRRTLHDRITGQNYTPEEIDAEAKDIANTEKPERPRNRGQ